MKNSGAINTGTHHLIPRLRAILKSVRRSGNDVSGRMRCRPGLAIVFALAIPIGIDRGAILSAQSPPHWKGTISHEGEVTVVRNPKEPMFKGEVLSFVEELVIPTTGPKDQYLISEIRNTTLDDEGRIYVLDGKSSDIKVFDASGKFLQTISRKGQGPGELDGPSQLSINRSNGELCVQQASRLSFFSPEGAFLRQVSFGTIMALMGKIDSAGNIVFLEGILSPPNSWYALKKFDLKLDLLVELQRFPANRRTAYDAFFPMGRWTIDDQDNIIYGYPKTYEVLVFNPQNKLVRKIQKEYSPIKITDQEAADAKKGLAQGYIPAFSKFRPAFRNIVADDQGRIYVQTYHKNAAGHYAFFDLFDKEGRYLATLTLKERAFIRKGKMYSVEEDEDGNQTIKRYAVTWKLK